MTLRSYATGLEVIQQVPSRKIAILTPPPYALVARIGKTEHSNYSKNREVTKTLEVVLKMVCEWQVIGCLQVKVNVWLCQSSRVLFQTSASFPFRYFQSPFYAIPSPTRRRKSQETQEHRAVTLEQDSGSACNTINASLFFKRVKVPILTYGHIERVFTSNRMICQACWVDRELLLWK